MDLQDAFKFEAKPLKPEVAKEKAKFLRYSELDYCTSNPIDFKGGGSGMTLYFTMLQWYMVMFLVMSLVTIPIYIYQFQMMQLSSYQQKFLYLDVFSYGSIFNLLNANVATPLRTLEYDSSGNILYWDKVNNVMTTDGSNYDSTKTVAQNTVLPYYFIDPYANTKDQSGAPYGSSYTPSNKSNSGALFLPNIMYAVDGETDFWYLWYSIFIASTFVCSLLYFVTYQGWLSRSEELLEEIDAALISPSDFSVEIKVRRGCCGCCKEFPLANVGSGQLLAFVDRMMDTNVFPEKIDYWKQDEADQVNSMWSEENQLEKILQDEKSPYDIKCVLPVKKLDNSIYLFQGLAVKAKEIVREKTRVYMKFKKDKESEEFDQEAYDKAMNKDGDVKEIQALLDEYMALYENIKTYRQDSKEYDEIDTLYCIASFRTQELREEFEEKIADMNNCYTMKYNLCCCCFTFPEDLHFRDSNGKLHRIDVNRVQGEPGDYKWENVYVDPTEKCCRMFFYFLILFILLLGSLVAMIFLVMYQNSLPKGTDCVVVPETFLDWIWYYVSDYTSLDGTQTALTTSIESLVSISTTDFTAWKNTIKADNATYTNTDMVYDQVFYCYCTLNIANTANLPACSQEVADYGIITGLPIGIAVAVAVISAILDSYINQAIDFVRPSSNSTKLAYQVYFTSIAYYINMALIPVLTGYNWQIGFLKDLLGATLYDSLTNFSSANPKDIDNLWYTIVGFQLLSNFVLNAVTPNVTAAVKILAFNCIGACTLCCGSAVTEDDYVEIYQGPKYDMEYQYSYILNHMAICLTFAPSMPILYIIGFLGTMFLYNVDKLALIYAYRKPTDVNDTVNNAGNSFLFGIIVLNILWATYTFSNRNFFCTETRFCPDGEVPYALSRLVALDSIFQLLNNDYSASDSNQVVTNILKETFAVNLFNIMLLIIVLNQLFKKTMAWVFHCVCFPCIWCCCSKSNKVADEGEGEEEKEIEYTREFVKNPVFSYNLFDNREYKDIMGQLKLMARVKSGKVSMRSAEREGEE